MFSSKWMDNLCLLLVLIPTIGLACGTEDCPIDCADKYKCVDHSDLCQAMKSQCENFFFRKCMRCACPKTCGVCDGSSSESAEEEPESSSSSSSTSSSTSSFSPSSPPSSSPSSRSSSSPTTEVTSIVPARANATQITRYPAAKLEVCECNLWRHPEIEDFVEEMEMKNKTRSVVKYGQQVAVEWIPGTPPTLVLLYANGTAAKTMQIGGWTRAKLTAYLDENLEQVNGTVSGGEGFGINVGNLTIPIGRNATKTNGTVVAEKLQQNQDEDSEEADDDDDEDEE